MPLEPSQEGQKNRRFYRFDWLEIQGDFIDERPFQPHDNVLSGRPSYLTQLQPYPFDPNNLAGPPFFISASTASQVLQNRAVFVVLALITSAGEDLSISSCLPPPGLVPATAEHGWPNRLFITVSCCSRSG